MRLKELLGFFVWFKLNRRFGPAEGVVATRIKINKLFLPRVFLLFLTQHMTMRFCLKFGPPTQIGCCHKFDPLVQMRFSLTFGPPTKLGRCLKFGPPAQMRCYLNFCPLTQMGLCLASGPRMVVSQMRRVVGGSRLFFIGFWRQRLSPATLPTGPSRRPDDVVGRGVI